MLTPEQLENNKNEFIKILSSITPREGMRLEELINKLKASDFFKAPASTKYYGSYEGGLCEHALNVYNNLMKLKEMKNMAILNSDSIIITSLLSDMSKMNFFETYVQNKKVYSPAGSKKDEMGAFDWVAVQAYKIKDVEDRFLYGNHEVTSEFMIRQYIPLSYDESVAILHHHGGTDDASNKDNIAGIFARYPLACLLHMADQIATFIDRNE